MKLAKKLGVKRVRLKFGQNQVVERLFRTVKQRVHWLNKFKEIGNARNFFALWICFYNFVREHNGIKKVPCEALGYKRMNNKDLIVNLISVVLFVSMFR